MMSRKNDRGWIPVEEALPEDERQVLVSMYRHLTWVTIGSYVGGEWVVNQYFTELGVDVRAWQPLPQPYEPERKIEAKTEEFTGWKAKMLKTFCKYE